MIQEQDLLEAIAECQGERSPNANTCIKLAAYYTILENMRGTYKVEPTGQSFSSGSEFSALIIGKNPSDVLSVMDDLMDAVAALAPRLYQVTVEKLRRL